MAHKLRDMSEWFPVVSLTGPRQSGKSTLIKAVFPEYEYLNLENPEVRRAALDDPVGFISRRPDHLIIDEAQYAPELFSMIQVASDERGRAGQYVLSGSQNFLLMHNIQQSLAGRVGMLKLLPLSYQELGDTQIALDTYLIRGGYPRIYDAGIPTDVFFQNYLMTYVERDAGGLLDVRNLSSFRKMIGLCAACVGGCSTCQDSPPMWESPRRRSTRGFRSCNQAIWCSCFSLMPETCASGLPKRQNCTSTTRGFFAICLAFTTSTVS